MAVTQWCWSLPYGCGQAKVCCTHCAVRLSAIAIQMFLSSILITATICLLPAKICLSKTLFIDKMCKLHVCTVSFGYLLFHNCTIPPFVFAVCNFRFYKFQFLFCFAECLRFGFTTEKLSPFLSRNAMMNYIINRYLVIYIYFCSATNVIIFIP